jgi:hypothetical protein
MGVFLPGFASKGKKNCEILTRLIRVIKDWYTIVGRRFRDAAPSEALLTHALNKCQWNVGKKSPPVAEDAEEKSTYTKNALIEMSPMLSPKCHSLCVSAVN